MGGIIAPASGSSIWPACTARVPKLCVVDRAEESGHRPSGEGVAEAYGWRRASAVRLKRRLAMIVSGQ